MARVPEELVQVSARGAAVGRRGRAREQPAAPCRDGVGHEQGVAEVGARHLVSLVDDEVAEDDRREHGGRGGGCAC